MELVTIVDAIGKTVAKVEVTITSEDKRTFGPLDEPAITSQAVTSQTRLIFTDGTSARLDANY